MHNDAPLTCRIPARPLAASERVVGAASSAAASDEYIPMSAVPLVHLLPTSFPPLFLPLQ